MKLILVPLCVLLILSGLSMCGLGAITADASKGFMMYDVRTSTDASGAYLYLYDSGGHALTYWNGTTVGEEGYMQKAPLADEAMWHNATNRYTMYYEDGTVVKWSDVQGSLGFNLTHITPSGAGTITFNDSLSWVVVIIAIMGIGALVGFKVFGSGESEISVDLILKGTFYLTVWGILTVMAYPLIMEGGFWIYLIYFAIALTYTLGVINSVGSPQSD